MIRIGKFSTYPGKLFYFAISDDGIVGDTFEGEMGFVRALADGKHLNDELLRSKVWVLEFFVDVDTAMPGGYLLLKCREALVAVWAIGERVFATYLDTQSAIDDSERWPEKAYGSTSSYG